MQRFAAIAATSLALTLASYARAETFSLSIVDPLGCAEQQHLIQQVTARAKGATFIEAGGRLSFVLRFQQSTGRIVAELQTTKPNNTESTRVLDGQSCAEVISAVALVMALTLDPRKGSDETLAEPVTAADASPAPQSSSMADSTPEPRDPSLTNSANTPPTTSPPTAATTNRSRPYWVEGDFADTAAKQPRKNSPKRSTWRVGIGADLKWTNLFTNKGGMWLLGLRGEAAKAQGLFAVVHASVGPRVLRDDGRGVSTAFSFYGVGAELGTPVVGSRRLAIDAMVSASMGALHAAATQREMVTSSRDATGTWIGLGPGVRLRWFSEMASLAVETTVPINLSRPRVIILSEFGTAEVFYQTPPVGIFFGLCGTWNVEPSNENHRMIKSEPGGD